MLNFLFRRLTAEPAAGAKLFEAITAEARRPSWYVEGAVPDTLDGRFAVLASLTALSLVRLEQLGASANLLAAALTEQFVHVMEAEHRELGLGDPTLGKTVRKLVGALAGRVDTWRAAAGGESSWLDAARHRLYKNGVEDAAVRYSAERMSNWWERLCLTPLTSLEQGAIQ
jgi:cytochrome b pre-mRNA-processing protein 3